MDNIKRCHYIPHTLYFYRPAGTSRGILYEKLSYFIIAEQQDGQLFYGECGLLKGLSIDDRPDYEDTLMQVCKAIVDNKEHKIDLSLFPSIKCGVEILGQAQKNQNNGLIYENDFYHKQESIPINGLIWMGEPSFMKEQIHQKINNGFRCIKMKVGAIDWEKEKELLSEMRVAGGDDLTIRVDANGAWGWNDETKHKLDFLDSIQVHSIEQPIKPGKIDEIAALSEWSPVDIALDEELFQHTIKSERAKLLDALSVEYIVLKPSLVGGFAACDEWIELAKERNMDYWLTSALESNVALNAITQYTYMHQSQKFQGLGTGSLYENNIPSPLEIKGDEIIYNQEKSWDYSLLHE